MIKSETFSKYYLCDEDVATQIARYCNMRNITKDMIIVCKIERATDGTVRQQGSLIYEEKEVE